MFELKFISKYPQEIIATDEVGRGPLAGPVVIGAVRIYVENKNEFQKMLKFLKTKGVNDSKKLSGPQRQDIFTKLGITEFAFRSKQNISLKGFKLSYTVWEMDHQVIDQENILAASLRGMKEASRFLSQKNKIGTTVLIDGHMKFRWGTKVSPWTEVPIIKGDSKSVLIGLASIIAKETRDNYMRQLDEIYPLYGFKSHYGYPTKNHREAIKTNGPCPIHRKSFKGVREFVGP